MATGPALKPRDYLMHEKDMAGAAGDYEEMEQLVSREHPGVDNRPVPRLITAPML